MHPDTAKYNQSLAPEDQAICDLLAGQIDKHLPEACPSGVVPRWEPDCRLQQAEELRQAAVLEWPVV